MRPDRSRREEEAPFAKRPKPGKTRDEREVLPLPDLQIAPRRVEAILTADWHLWHKPPIARSDEQDWWDAQAGYLEQLRMLQECKNGPLATNIPIVCAGDIFHKPSPPIDFVNFVIREMPARVYAIPGNHDLLHHSLKDIKKTAYWNLVEAGKITDLKHNEPVEAGSMILDGYPYGIDPEPLQAGARLLVNVAVVHQYVWTEKTGFPGAPESCRLGSFRKKVHGYDLVVIGDNHKPFISSKQKPTVCNCGSLMRRSIDQEDYEPRVWLLWSDGEVTPHYLDVSKDKPMVNTRKEKSQDTNLSRVKRFVKSLDTSEEESLSAEEVLTEYLKRESIPPAVERLILEALGESKR